MKNTQKKKKKTLTHCKIMKNTKKRRKNDEKEKRKCIQVGWTKFVLLNKIWFGFQGYFDYFASWAFA